MESLALEPGGAQALSQKDILVAALPVIGDPDIGGQSIECLFEEDRVGGHLAAHRLDHLGHQEALAREPVAQRQAQERAAQPVALGRHHVHRPLRVVEDRGDQHLVLPLPGHCVTVRKNLERLDTLGPLAGVGVAVMQAGGQFDVTAHARHRLAGQVRFLVDSFPDPVMRAALDDEEVRGGRGAGGRDWRREETLRADWWGRGQEQRGQEKNRDDRAQGFHGETGCRVGRRQKDLGRRHGRRSAS